MKLIFIILFSLLIGYTASAQSSGDSTKAKPVNEELVKKNDNGNSDSKFNGKKKNKDVFVDKDGDGICDNRAKGMSFEKLRKRYHGSEGKKGGQGYQGGKK